MAIPGSAGIPLLGDKSVEFYKDPIGFVQRRVDQYHSAIFQARLLNQPTVFVTSNQGVIELLQDEADSIEMGYKALMYGIYGDNVVFTEGEEAEHLRDILKQVILSSDSLSNFQQLVDRLTGKYLKKLSSKATVPVYTFFKRLSTEICLSLFLDLNFDTCSDLSEKIVALTTTHWHGIISVPVSLRLLNKTSTYNKAIVAKNELVHIIRDKIDAASDSGFSRRMRDGNFPNVDVAANHILLFTSALVPKALASLITSFIIATANRKPLRAEARRNKQFLDCILLEVQRMWPPFVAGRRILKKECKVEGFTLPAGYVAMYMTHQAHRDPTVFRRPRDFWPERWNTENEADRNKLFLFGVGSRDCIGQKVVWNILQTVCCQLLEHYEWEILEGQDLVYKWLPVSRPQSPVHVCFTSRT